MWQRSLLVFVSTSIIYVNLFLNSSFKKASNELSWHEKSNDYVCLSKKVGSIRFSLFLLLILFFRLSYLYISDFLSNDIVLSNESQSIVFNIMWIVCLDLYTWVIKYFN